MNVYTVGQLASMFDVSKQTVRDWSREFSSYLSTDANPDKGNSRTYVTADLEVLGLVARMRKIHKAYDEIHGALQEGTREFNIVNDQETSTTETQLQPADQAVPNDQRLLTEIETLQYQLGSAKKQIERANKYAKALVEAYEREKMMVQQVAKLEKQINDLEAQKDDLMRELTKTYIDGYKAGWQERQAERNGV